MTHKNVGVVIITAIISLAIGGAIAVSGSEPPAEPETITVTETVTPEPEVITETETVTEEVEVEVEVTPQACYDFADIAAKSEDLVRDAAVMASNGTIAFINLNYQKGNRLTDQALIKIEEANSLEGEWFSLRDECLAPH